jgi:hypothetical protein
VTEEPKSEMLMLVCMATGRLIDTGADYTRDDLAYAQRAKLMLRCPFCRKYHLFHFSDARLIPRENGGRRV